ncbi:MAG: hypothetical protein U0M42_08490 [Acutalibacteraceae bacterium]|nr:hypothetical protein [Acutalibacteraceae bacterium]
MELHSKIEAADYIWQYSHFHHFCLVQCENLYREEKGFSCVMILFNCLENISKSVANDYDSSLYDVFLKLYKQNIITKREYEFLNIGDFCIRKIRNLYAHKNIAAINFLADFEGKEILWPLTENETSLMIYSKISDIVFNLMVKMVSSGFIESVKEKFEAPLDEAIDECNIRYKILTSKELLVLKGYPEDYIPEDVDMPEDMRIRMVDNSPDLNINMYIYSQLVNELEKENDKKDNN